MDVKKLSTSHLISLLAHPPTGIPPDAYQSIAEEIDRRIPVPDPRIGKLVRSPASALIGVMRVVGVEPGGALRLRGDTWPHDAADLRVGPDSIAPDGWID